MGLVHPEVINGRRIWMDSAMSDIIDKIRNGDPTMGWDGDERLAVYSKPHPLGQRFELWRLEDDGEYRFVVSTEPGDPFDNTIIVWLVQNDRRRKPDNWSLHDEISAHNARIAAARESDRQDWIREEIAPRLMHALRKDGW